MIFNAVNTRCENRYVMIKPPLKPDQLADWNDQAATLDNLRF